MNDIMEKEHIKINKPITVARDDFIQSLTALINDSMLPPFIIEPILKDMYIETKAMAQRQLEQDRNNWNQISQK